MFQTGANWTPLGFLLRLTEPPRTQPGSLRKYTRGTLTQLSGNTRKSSVVPGFIYGHWNQFQ